MPCLFAMFAGFFPRFGTLFIWLARPALFSAAFGGAWLWPVLGIIFLPFTTLMYVILWSPAGLSAWDWLWLIMAVFLDISHYASAGYASRDRMPGYTPSAPVAAAGAVATTVGLDEGTATRPADAAGAMGPPASPTSAELPVQGEPARGDAPPPSAPTGAA